MNKEWYSFDVREEVLKDMKRFCAERGIYLPADMQMKDISTSTLMDSAYLESFLDADSAKLLQSYIHERFFYYRGEKYGNQFYWHAAASERDIGYGGRWLVFIEALLNQYIRLGSNVLFAGTANGAEIPKNNSYRYYALEQLPASAEQISSGNRAIHKVITGSFEDMSLIVDQPHTISCIVALRCLTSNCRLDRFAVFAKNNLSDDGTLILSYPMSYLDRDGNLRRLPDISEQLAVFEQKLNCELIDKLGMKFVDDLSSDVEKIYILQYQGDKQSLNKQGGQDHEDIPDQYAFQ